jgi:hypothetical protein
MDNPHVYDKAKYHYESVEGFGLPAEHASNHTVPMLRWLIENDLMSTMFKQDGEQALTAFADGSSSIHKVYEWWDCCLISDMLSEQGNAFAMQYFDFERGKYISDYKTTLQGSLPSEFHVQYTEENYSKLKAVIDRRYSEWKERTSLPWWKIWK